MLSVRLPSGQDLPMLGLGTYKLTGRACTDVVLKALDLGYRHLDTADFYANHEAIGAALTETRVPREEIFLTTKVWRDALAYADVKKMAMRALKELRTEYLDLLLIHWPNNEVPLEETFRAFKELLDAGTIRNAGVSNFTLKRLEQARKAAPFALATNQVEYHVDLNQDQLRRFCLDHDITPTAYCPLGRGDLAKHAALAQIGAGHGKTAAQVALRWLVEKAIVAIPKTQSPARLKENLEIFDFKLSAEEVRRIDGLSKNARLINFEAGEFDQ